VADRAYVRVLEENSEKVSSRHSGYEKKFGIIHTREWYFSEDRIVIKDSLSKSAEAVARLHFHPDVTEAMIKRRITINQSLITNVHSLLSNYQYASEFNKLVDALVLEIPFEKELEVSIIL
jgi:hypothetical protein